MISLFAVSVLFLGVLLVGAWRPPREHSVTVAERISRVAVLLPQTQCRQCGYAGCRPYAEAIVKRGEDVTRCRPGGGVTQEALAELLGRKLPRSDIDSRPPQQRAEVVEAQCIGCTKCVVACPVDAIVGAHKRMHTVLNAVCTGCGLCLPPCPVDCIELKAAPLAAAQWRWHHPRGAATESL